jgi:anti-anti-sigma factor
MKLTLVSIEKQGLIRVAAEENVTAADFDADGTNPLAKLLGVTWSSNKVLMDFSNVPYIDSSAVGWLITCHRSFKEAGGTFVVHSIQPSVRQILDVLKIGKVVALAENEEAARALAMGGGQ